MPSAAQSIARFGRFDVVARNARDNFEQSTSQVGIDREPGRLRPSAGADRGIAGPAPCLDRTIEPTAALPCDGHGDIRMDHVYLFPEVTAARRRGDRRLHRIQRAVSGRRPRRRHGVSGDGPDPARPPRPGGLVPRCLPRAPRGDQGAGRSCRSTCPIARPCGPRSTASKPARARALRRRAEKAQRDARRSMAPGPVGSSRIAASARAWCSWEGCPVRASRRSPRRWQVTPVSRSSAPTRSAKSCCPERLGRRGCVQTATHPEIYTPEWNDTNLSGMSRPCRRGSLRRETRHGRRDLPRMNRNASGFSIWRRAGVCLRYSSFVRPMRLQSNPGSKNAVTMCLTPTGRSIFRQPSAGNRWEHRRKGRPICLTRAGSLVHR